MAKLKRTMGCGCILGLDYDGTLAIFYCSKHEAAPKMYEACKQALIHSEIPTDSLPLHVIKELEQALAKAGGKR